MRNIFFKSLIKKIVKATEIKEAKKNLDLLNHFKKFFKLKIHKKFIKSINRNFSLLTMHFQYNFLDTNTNSIENINRKLKNIDGFKSEKNMINFMKIWFHYY